MIPITVSSALPDWETLVHLDDEESPDLPKLGNALRVLLSQPGRTKDEEWRVFQLLTIVELLAPPEATSNGRPGYFPFRRAATLLLLGKPELALREIEEGAGSALEMPRAITSSSKSCAGRTCSVPASKPRRLRRCRTSPPALLAECVNILATHADNLPEDQFPPVAERILDWAERSSAPGRERIAPGPSHSSSSTKV